MPLIYLYCGRNNKRHSSTLDIQMKTYFKTDMLKKRQRKSPVLDITENQLQDQLNDVLDAYQIRYLRIADWVWEWIKKNAPVEIKKELSKRFAGMPDNVPLIPIDDKFSLSMPIELKVKDRKKHGKQKHWQSTISETPDTNISLVQEYLDTVEIIKLLWIKYKGE